MWVYWRRDLGLCSVFLSLQRLISAAYLHQCFHLLPNSRNKEPLIPSELVDYCCDFSSSEKKEDSFSFISKTKLCWRLSCWNREDISKGFLAIKYTSTWMQILLTLHLNRRLSFHSANIDYMDRYHKLFIHTLSFQLLKMIFNRVSFVRVSVTRVTVTSLHQDKPQKYISHIFQRCKNTWWMISKLHRWETKCVCVYMSRRHFVQISR